MPSVFTSERRVEFCETDAAGIAHFSSLIIYMEQAEHALLRSVGLSVAADNASSREDSLNVRCSWPRVKVECEFKSPAKFEEVIAMQTCIASLGTKSVTYQHQLAIGNAIIASGKITSVCCTRFGDNLSSIEIPTHIRELLLPFVA